LSQVGGHIKRFIVYVAKNGEERALNPMARFNIKLSPAGEVQSVRLIQTSGFKNWDLTAARAIEKSSPLPLPEEGGPPEEIELLIQPKDDR
jgi:TonB family protein